MYEATTRSIRVSVESFYVKEQSSPAEQRWVFGYRVTIANEGTDVAKWLAERGIAAFVLKHRLGNDESNPKDTPQPYKWDVHGVADGRRAIQIVRSRAAEWGVNPNAIGMMGFSAGGEIVAQLMMKPEDGKADAADPLERLSSKLNFQALIYPGTSGLFEAEKGMPPLFIAAGYGDRKDISEGMATLYLKYKAAGVKAEMHMYSNAGHGFGYRPDAKPSGAARWPERSSASGSSRGSNGSRPTCSVGGGPASAMAAARSAGDGPGRVAHTATSASAYGDPRSSSASRTSSMLAR